MLGLDVCEFGGQMLELLWLTMCYRGESSQVTLVMQNPPLCFMDALIRRVCSSLSWRVWTVFMVKGDKKVLIPPCCVCGVAHLQSEESRRTAGRRVFLQDDTGVKLCLFCLCSSSMMCLTAELLKSNRWCN